MQKVRRTLLPFKGQSSHIYERIFLADCNYGGSTDRIIADGIKVVINISEVPTPLDMIKKLDEVGVVCRYIEVDYDQPSTDLSDAMLEALGILSAYDGKTVIHCAAGCSRSAAVVLYLLCKFYMLTLEAAVDLMVSRRPCVSPLHSYLEQVYKLLRDC